MWIISEVTMMGSKAAKNMRKPSEVIEVLAKGLSTSEVRAFWVAFFITGTRLRRGRRGREGKADGFSCTTTGLWRCRSCPGRRETFYDEGVEGGDEGGEDTDDAESAERCAV